VFNALDFGLPQKRERVFIVGFRDERDKLNFKWPEKSKKSKTLDDILEKDIDKKYYASDLIVNKRLAKKEKTNETTIWHENKAGNVSVYPYSCALRAGASYNYLLVNGERRLTEREMLRLQGFPESFKIICNYTQTRKQVGNSLPVPIATAVISGTLKALDGKENAKEKENENKNETGKENENKKERKEKWTTYQLKNDLILCGRLNRIKTKAPNCVSSNYSNNLA
jgi:DNA (cytosine-5)-methyltransferase 1